MPKKYALAIVIFRRDLRLHDNTALISALAEADLVLPVFILDPRQTGHQNEYRSERALRFMLESLKALNSEITTQGGVLYLCQGQSAQVVDNLIRETKAGAIYANRDYTLFAKIRDDAIQETCNHHRIPFILCDDYLLTRPEDLLTGNGTAYRVFSAFFNKAKNQLFSKPIKATPRFSTTPLKTNAVKFDNLLTSLSSIQHPNTPLGGRAAAKKILGGIEKFEAYAETRNYPAQSLGTTRLSPYIKFGCVSVREVYHAVANKLGSSHGIIRELFFRDFFTHIAFHFPHVFGQPFSARYKNIKWSKANARFELWCQGQTGFPIVDAGMRELNQTGLMHNRLRMITASFLVKDLHIDWRWGERYFAQHLVDYDPAVNNGNWQWVAGTGVDAQPYFRIFNPWIQQKKFDRDCVYIKRWVPELEQLSASDIHRWQNQQIRAAVYPKPILDHRIEAAKALDYYGIG